MSEMVSGLRQPKVCPVCKAPELDRVPDGVRAYPHPMVVMLAGLAHVGATRSQEHEWLCLHCSAIGWSDGLYVLPDSNVGATWQAPGPEPSAPSMSVPRFTDDFKRLLASRPPWQVRR